MVLLDVMVVAKAEGGWGNERGELVQFRSLAHRTQQLGLCYYLLAELHFPKRMAPGNQQVSH